MPRLHNSFFTFSTIFSPYFIHFYWLLSARFFSKNQSFSSRNLQIQQITVWFSWKIMFAIETVWIVSAVALFKKEAHPKVLKKRNIYLNSGWEKNPIDELSKVKSFWVHFQTHIFKENIFASLKWENYFLALKIRSIRYLKFLIWSNHPLSTPSKKKVESPICRIPGGPWKPLQEVGVRHTTTRKLGISPTSEGRNWKKGKKEKEKRGAFSHRAPNVKEICSTSNFSGKLAIFGFPFLPGVDAAAARASSRGRTVVVAALIPTHTRGESLRKLG